MIALGSRRKTRPPCFPLLTYKHFYLRKGANSTDKFYGYSAKHYIAVIVCGAFHMKCRTAARYTTRLNCCGLVETSDAQSSNVSLSPIARGSGRFRWTSKAWAGISSRVFGRRYCAQSVRVWQWPEKRNPNVRAIFSFCPHAALIREEWLPFFFLVEIESLMSKQVLQLFSVLNVGLLLAVIPAGEEKDNTSLRSILRIQTTVIDWEQRKERDDRRRRRRRRWQSFDYSLAVKFCWSTFKFREAVIRSSH